MSSIFFKLLDNTMAEVYEREPAYTSAFPITLSYEGTVSACANHPLCNKLPPGALEQGLIEGLAYVAKGWIEPKQASAGTDPIAQCLCNSIVDALCADHGLLALQPHNRFNGSVVEVLSQQYSKRQAPGGINYYVRNAGTLPLLLINATGAPVAVWKQLLADSTHEFKIILPVRRGSDLFQGGLLQHVDIQTDSSDLASILDAESLDRFDVLAWCNGGKVAIDLTTRTSRQISSLVLLGPMLKGVKGVSAAPSNFERDMQPLLDAVSKESSLASFLSEAISKQPRTPDWERLRKTPKSRAQAFFSMPAKEHANAVVAMLTNAQSFINIARRVASDESYPMAQALEKLETRTMVIMGSDDNVVSNALASSAIKKMCHNSIPRAVLGGSGHYIQDLQYHYLRWLLTDFLAKNRSPQSTARMRVEGIGCS